MKTGTEDVGSKMYFIAESTFITPTQTFQWVVRLLLEVSGALLGRSMKSLKHMYVSSVKPGTSTEMCPFCSVTMVLFTVVFCVRKLSYCFVFDAR